MENFNDLKNEFEKHCSIFFKKYDLKADVCHQLFDLMKFLSFIDCVKYIALKDQADTAAKLRDQLTKQQTEIYAPPTTIKIQEH